MMIELKKKLKIENKNYFYILNAIRSANGEGRLVGGVVRDALLSVDLNDVDIATNLLPDQVTQLFNSLGCRVIATGIKFGTVSVLYNGEIFEITTLRKDISSDGRHAKVEYTNDFYLDAIRRDFTINALSYCPFEEKIYDYFGGIKDLELGLVRFIGSADRRIKEDYLRILRFFRFFGRFGKKIDEESLNSCALNRSLIKNLSRERTKSEFDLILKLPNYLDIIKLMNDLSVLQEILPISNLDLDKFVKAEDITKKLNINLLNETKYALLFAYNDVKSSELIGLKFSKKQSRIVSNLLLSLQQKSVDEVFLKEIWLEKHNFSQFYVFLAAIFGIEDIVVRLFFDLSTREKPHFPVNGDDLLPLGVRGANIKKELSYLKKIWVKSDFTLTKEILINMIKNHEK